MKGGLIEMENKNIAIILAVGILVVAVFLYNGNGAVVSARGQSVLDVEPDQVSVYVRVEEKGSTAQEAKDKMVEVSDDILTELIKLGLERKQVEFVNLNIREDFVWENGGRTSKGFVASQDMNVKSDDFDLVPGIVDAAIDSGGLVSYINFEISEKLRSEYKSKALELAGEDAKEKARATAAGLGKKLGRLVSVQSEDFNYGPVVYYAGSGVANAESSALARDAALNISPRDVEVRASISVQYKLRSF
jgi:uncharacterized protein YggE